MTPLRRGDVVRVRSRKEILATLDADGTIAGLPFMPDMLQFCGTEQTVYASAHKTCDTVEHLGRSREVPNAVHLSGVRCDGLRARADARPNAWSSGAKSGWMSVR